MRLIALILMLIVPSWTLADQYICISEDASGFYYDDETNKWKSTFFTDLGEKYLVSVKDMNVRKFGIEGAIFENCHNAEISITRTGKDTKLFLCNAGINGQFHMNPENLKYLRTLPYIGYIIDEDIPPSIEIGTCTNF